MADKSIECQGIAKSYKGFFGKRMQILKDITLQVEAGRSSACWGRTARARPRSSPSSPPSSTRIGAACESWEWMPSVIRTEIRAQINISTAKPNFPWSLTVKENLRHYGMLYGMYGSALSRAVQEQIDAFELGDHQDMTFENLSTGLKQRLSLAKAMLNRPRLLFLDEPTTGLDPDISIRDQGADKEDS